MVCYLLPFFFAHTAWDKLLHCAICESANYIQISIHSLIYVQHIYRLPCTYNILLAGLSTYNTLHMTCF